MRIVFMGSPEFAVPSLSALHEAGQEVIAVYSQPPRPAGRGKGERRTAVHERAEELGIEVRTPETLRNEDEQAQFRELNADFAVVAAYGLILPQPILDAPRLGCINVHASLLPRWRGAAPIQRAIIAGDKTSGITL
ncbi:MAG: methionyl-tRNA formyltransferase, partial [Sphingomicrobium sp.]